MLLHSAWNIEGDGAKIDRRACEK